MLFEARYAACGELDGGVEEDPVWMPPNSLSAGRYLE